MQCGGACLVVSNIVPAGMHAILLLCILITHNNFLYNIVQFVLVKIKSELFHLLLCLCLFVFMKMAYLNHEVFHCADRVSELQHSPRWSRCGQGQSELVLSCCVH